MHSVLAGRRDTRSSASTATITTCALRNNRAGDGNYGEHGVDGLVADRRYRHLGLPRLLRRPWRSSPPPKDRRCAWIASRLRAAAAKGLEAQEDQEGHSGKLERDEGGLRGDAQCGRAGTRAERSAQRSHPATAPVLEAPASTCAPAHRPSRARARVQSRRPFSKEQSCFSARRVCRPLLRFVHPSSEWTLEPGRRDGSFPEKQESAPAHVLVVQSGRLTLDFGDARNDA
jgi:hypothetical protein